jgi:DNA-binding transcriptional MerR regulator
MDYLISELAHMAGISTRTLRYYDKIGLLKPDGVNASGYRKYSGAQTDKLQQILFFCELGFELSEIKSCVNDPLFDKTQALYGHLEALKRKKIHIEKLIEAVNLTIQKEMGEITMQDDQKFEAFKQALVDKNEAEYGTEARDKYGDAAVNASNAKLMGMDSLQYGAFEKLGKTILEMLEAAVGGGCDPCGPQGEKIAQMHKEWLCHTWSDYSAQAHLGLVRMYVADERFKSYYDANVTGCAEFLCAAVESALKR